jgi:hypothetical protein
MAYLYAEYDEPSNNINIIQKVKFAYIYRTIEALKTEKIICKRWL